MALQRVITSKICSKIPTPFLVLQSHLNNTVTTKKASTIEVDDALDIFTTSLIQKNITSSVLEKNTFNSVKKNWKTKAADTDLNPLHERELSRKLKDALDGCHDTTIIKILQTCLNKSVWPSQELIVPILQICARQGELKLILQLEELSLQNVVIFEKTFSFHIYEAYAIWMRGNVLKSLDIFETLYRNNPFLRRNIKLSLKNLIANETKGNSEAVLLQIIKFSENIVENYQDHFLMLCVWEACFMSDWYSDQNIALELIRKNHRLAELLGSRLPFILTWSLSNNRIEPVYKLLEVLLDFKMTGHYRIIAMSLLDYQFLRRNHISYKEILKWCEVNSIALPVLYSQKYLQLLLKKPGEVNDPPKVRKHKCKFLF